MKLSNIQLNYLKALKAQGERSAYPGMKLNVLQALEQKGLVKAYRGLGSMAMPHNSIKWSITNEGIRIIE